MRSNKSDPSANGEKAASNSQSSASNNNNKDKSTAGRGKTVQSKKVAGKATGTDQQQPKGSPDPRENGVNGSEDVEMGDDDPAQKRDKDGDDEMTVVVPPSKSKSGNDKDVTMEGAEGDEATKPEDQVDPVEKAAAGKNHR